MTKLIVALDVDSFSKAKSLVDRLYPLVKFFKVGSQLFTSAGLKIIDYINKKGAKVFLDLKYHDIPNTVANAVVEAVRLKVFMLTVHAQGGTEMLEAARNSAKETAKDLRVNRPFIVAVTVLTSQRPKNARQRVLDLADDAYASGIDGVVASVEECSELKKIFKKNFIIVTPGIRPQGADIGDQKRIATPKVAQEAGSDYIVVGRPIVEAKDPLLAAKEILKEIKV